LPAIAVALLVLLLLFVLLHGQNVLQEPLKNNSIAVNGYVYFILVRYLLQALVEVFHVLNQEGARESEVSFFVLAVVNHVNHYRVSKVLVGDVR